MKNKIFKILILTLITTIILAITNISYAVDVLEDLDFWEPTYNTGSDKLETLTGKILGAITTVGVVASVLTIGIIGLKTMTVSVEEKAQYKKNLAPWLMGAILVFSITTVPTILYNVTKGEETKEEVHISLSKSSVLLKLGEEEEATLTATVTSETPKTVRWYSDDPMIVTVDSNGKLVARGEGTTDINAYAGNAVASCRVTVEAAKTMEITISKKSITLDAPITMTATLTARKTPPNSREAIVWTSSDRNVATVENGKVRAVGAGTATITVKSGSKSDTCTVQVNSQREYSIKYYNPTTKTVSTTKTSDKDMDFILYVPPVSQVKNVDKLPMIVYLHGGTKSNIEEVKYEDHFNLKNKDYPAIFILPRCPDTYETRYGWSGAHNESYYKPVDSLIGIIDYLIKNYNVDSNKVSLTGYSNGGGGTWTIGIRNPKLFSCLVFVGNGHSVPEPKLSEGQGYPDCPVKIFAAECGIEGDVDYSRGPARDMEALLKSAGKQVQVIDFGNTRHSKMPGKSYTEETINWMIERSRLTNADYKFP